MGTSSLKEEIEESESLKNAIEAYLEAEECFGHETANGIARRIASGVPPSSLSPRQRDVLEIITRRLKSFGCSCCGRTIELDDLENFFSSEERVGGCCKKNLTKPEREFE